MTVVTNFPRYNLPVMPQQYRGRLFCTEEMADAGLARQHAEFLRCVHVESRISPNSSRRLPFASSHFRVPSGCHLHRQPPTPPRHCVVAALVVVSSAVCGPHHGPISKAAVDLGLIRNRSIIRFFEIMERFVYKHTSALTVAARSMGNPPSMLVPRPIESSRCRFGPTWMKFDRLAG